MNNPITYGTLLAFNDSFYIVATARSEKPGTYIVLVNLHTGNIWSEAIQVKDFKNISINEIAKALRPEIVNPIHIKEMKFANAIDKFDENKKLVNKTIYQSPQDDFVFPRNFVYSESEYRQNLGLPIIDNSIKISENEIIKF